MMVGAGASRPRLAEPLSEFVRRTRMPFFNTQMGKGAVAGGSNLYMGTAALSEGDYVHRAVDRADLIISIGHDTIEKPPFIMGADGPQVIHVGFSSANVEQVFFPHAEVVGDVGPSLALLADRLEGKLAIDPAFLALRRRSSPVFAIAQRRGASHRRRSASSTTSARSCRRTASLPRQRHVQDMVRAQLPYARRQHALARQRARHDGRRAAVGDDGVDALPDRRVLAVCGDGGFMMNSQEMETAVRLGLNLVVLILEDRAYGMIRWKQAVDKFPDWGLTFGNPDFVRYAEAYGATGSAWNAPRNWRPTLETAFADGGVQLVAVPIDYAENTSVLVEELQWVSQR